MGKHRSFSALEGTFCWKVKNESSLHSVIPGTQLALRKKVLSGE